MPPKITTCSQQLRQNPVFSGLFKNIGEVISCYVLKII